MELRNDNVAPLVEAAEQADWDTSYQRQCKRHYKNTEKRLDLVSKFKTKKYMAQLRELMDEAGVHSAEFVRGTGKGKKQKSDYPAIKWEWVDQYENGGYSGDSYSGYIYIELKPNRYLKLNYSM